jgi:hypothetical protein
MRARTCPLLLTVSIIVFAPEALIGSERKRG